MPGAAGDVDDAADAVLGGHLPVHPDGEPQRADQIHLHREGVEQRGALEVVVAARCALNALHQFGNAFRVRRRNRPAGVVHQDVDAAVGGHDVGDEGVDRAVVALVANPLGRARRPVGVDAGDGVQRRPRAADDCGAGPQQLVGDADTDAPAGPGDDRDLAVEHAHEPTLLSLTVTARQSYCATHE